MLKDVPRSSGTGQLDAFTAGLADWLNNFGDACIVVDDEWRLVCVNSAAQAQWFAHRDDLLGHVLWEVSPDLLGTAIEDLLRKGMAERAYLESEVLGGPRSRSTYNVRLFPVGAGLAASFKDLTAEAEVRARERQQATALELLLAATDIGASSLDLETGEVTLSARAAELLGVAPRTKVSRAMIQAHQTVEDVARADAMIAAAVRTGEICEIEYHLRRPALGDEIWLMMRGRAQYDDTGRATSILGMVVDISRMRAQEAKIRESEARFRTFANSAPTPLWVTAADGSLEFANQAAVEYAGRSPTEVSLLVHPDDRDRVQRCHDEAWARREPYTVVTRLRSLGNGWRWIRAVDHPRYDPDGNFLGYIGSFMDVHEIREAEARQRILINELNHRVKNTLATVQSIIHQTLRPGMELSTARELLVDRLIVLSATHDVLTREHWQDADLMEIATAALRPYDVGERIHFHGSSVRVAAHVALALSMALHELATNAAKYGALSRATGRVSLSWKLAGDGDSLCLRWRERGGPAVQPPGRRGFGLRLLTQGLAGELGGPAELRFREAGLSCILSAPVLGPDEHTLDRRSRYANAFSPKPEMP